MLTAVRSGCPLELEVTLTVRTNEAGAVLTVGATVRLGVGNAGDGLGVKVAVDVAEAAGVAGWTTALALGAEDGAAQLVATSIARRSAEELPATLFTQVLPRGQNPQTLTRSQTILSQPKLRARSERAGLAMGKGCRGLSPIWPDES